MMWVSLAFLAAMIIAVVSFRLGFTAGRRSSSSVNGSNGDTRIDALEMLSRSTPPSERESATAETPPRDDFDKREQARHIFQQLKQLEKMRTDGVLTDIEYSEKRTELLKDR